MNEDVNLNHKAIEVDGPELLATIRKRMEEERRRGSDAKASGDKTKEYLEKTGLNSMAFSWLKTINKKIPMKDGPAKAMDVIRSLEHGLPIMKDMIRDEYGDEFNFNFPEDAEKEEDTNVTSLDAAKKKKAEASAKPKTGANAPAKRGRKRKEPEAVAAEKKEIADEAQDFEDAAAEIDEEYDADLEPYEDELEEA